MHEVVNALIVVLELLIRELRPVNLEFFHDFELPLLDYKDLLQLFILLVKYMVLSVV